MFVPMRICKSQWTCQFIATAIDLHCHKPTCQLNMLSFAHCGLLKAIIANFCCLYQTFENLNDKMISSLYGIGHSVTGLRVLSTKKECVKLLRKLGLHLHTYFLKLAFALHPEDKTLMGKAC